VGTGFRQKIMLKQKVRRAVAIQPDAKALSRHNRRVSINLAVKMPHVAAQKGSRCATGRLFDSLKLCYPHVEMAQTAAA
jgi:hypothetical protein